MEKPLTQELAERLKKIISDNSDWLIKRILFYAKNQGYSVYLPSMEEAWRQSVNMLNRPLLDTPSAYFSIPELNPHTDYSSDPYAQYGISEAKRHREMGVGINMFFGMFKYFRQTYDDLLLHCGFSAEDTVLCRTFLKRFFDRAELGFLNEYLGNDKADALDDNSAYARKQFFEKSMYLAVLESLEKPLIAVDRDGLVIHMNAAASELFGGGYRGGTFVYGEERPDMPQEIRKEISDFIVSGMQSREPRIVYDKKIFRLEMTRMKDVASKFGGAVVIMTDVTERRSAEASLAESESFRTALMEGIDGAAVVINMETMTIEEYNRKAAELFPYLISGTHGREPRFYDETGANPSDIFVLADSVTANEERLMESSTGETTPLRIFGIDVWYQNQRHKLLVMFDITREKMLERRLGYIQQLESVGEIAMGLPQRMGLAAKEVHHTLTQSLKALRDCPNQCGQSAAHELYPAMEKAEEYIATLTGLLDALESITHEDSIEKTLVDVDTVVRNCVLLSEDKWQPYSYIEIKTSGVNRSVTCYPDEIGQLVLNLILNAAYAVRKKCEADGCKGLIKISTRYTAEFFELKVADTGIGIKQKDYKRIFDSGFTTKEIGRGTGHGLSLVYDIAVNRYKGTIEFKSVEGEGTEFTVRIPF